MNSLPSTTGNGYCCCVPLCSNRSRLDPSLSFHRFPVESRSGLRKAWIHAIRREKFAVTSNTRVCSAHFKDEDFFQRGVVYFDGHPVGGDPEKENAGSLSQISIPRRLRVSHLNGTLQPTGKEYLDSQLHNKKRMNIAEQ